MRRIARTDSNQQEVVTALRNSGAVVLLTHQLKNCFDCLVCYNGSIFMVEIKDGSKPKSARKLTQGELEFKSKVESVGCTYWVIESVEDALLMLDSSTK